MTFTPITTLDIPELQIYRTLRDNACTADNSFIADSPKVVNVLLQTGIEVRSILATEAYYKEFGHLVEARGEQPVLYVADRKLMEQIVGHKIHNNVMMHGVRPALQTLDELGDGVLMLDLISKTENVGSMVRSAAALGVGSLLFPHNGPHPFGRRALRVSMGHASKLLLCGYNDIAATLAALKERGYRIFAAEVTETSTPLHAVAVSEKWVLLMGNEGDGLSAEVLALCDETVAIEMAPGVPSLNVGTAASILMYRFMHGA